jgi:hypothetical protein
MTRLFAFLFALAVLAACGGGSEDVAVDPTKLLADSAARMEGIQRFHYLLEHENGATAIVSGVQMTRAEGDVDGPERLSAAIAGRVATINIDTGIVILGDESWFQSPLTRRWERQEISIDEVFDPRSGVVALMRKAQSPRVTGTERIENVEVHRLEATLASADLTLLPGEPITGKTVKVVAWIGVEDPVVHRIELRGAAAVGEPENIVRRLTLTRFDEAFTIDPPR